MALPGKCKGMMTTFDLYQLLKPCFWPILGITTAAVATVQKIRGNRGIAHILLLFTYVIIYFAVPWTRMMLERLG